MNIRLAHLNLQDINVAIFDAKPAVDSDSARRQLLSDLTSRGRLAGLRIDKSALAYVAGNRNTFFGTPDLVRYLQNNGVSKWTHTIEV